MTGQLNEASSTDKPIVQPEDVNESMDETRTSRDGAFNPGRAMPAICEQAPMRRQDDRYDELWLMTKFLCVIFLIMVTCKLVYRGLGVSIEVRRAQDGLSFMTRLWRSSIPAFMEAWKSV